MDSLTHSLELLSNAGRYNRWIYSILRPGIGPDILEVGAGIGNITRFLLHYNKIVCLEIDPAYIDKLKILEKQYPSVTVVGEDVRSYCADPRNHSSFDTIICVNVLEHIHDDHAAVRGMLECLKPHGKLLLYVPACQAAFGTVDKALGHFRRYSKRKLRKLAIQCGARIDIMYYVNILGLLGWFWQGRIKKATNINRSNTRIMDTVAPLVAAVERVVKPPVGLSLFVSLTIKNHSATVSEK